MLILIESWFKSVGSSISINTNQGTIETNLCKKKYRLTLLIIFITLLPLKYIQSKRSNKQIWRLALDPQKFWTKVQLLGTLHPDKEMFFVSWKRFRNFSRASDSSLTLSLVGWKRSSTEQQIWLYRKKTAYYRRYVLVYRDSLRQGQCCGANN